MLHYRHKPRATPPADNRRGKGYTMTPTKSSNAQNVINQYGKTLNFAAAVNLMDDDIREQLHNELAPCTDQVFFDAYVNAHAVKFGENWVLDDPNPVW